MKKARQKLGIRGFSIFLALMLVMTSVMSGCAFVDDYFIDDGQTNQTDGKNDGVGDGANKDENVDKGDSANKDESGDNSGNEGEGENEDNGENDKDPAYVRCDKFGNENAAGEYILFGEYPQTVKADDVTITDTTDSRGYYLGSDGYYYAKLKATPCTSYYTFSTGEKIDGGSVYYFKVEPIRWRILSEENGEAFLLCDSIIANQRFAENSNNYAESEIRTWLNSTFYDTAFSELAKSLILITVVDNSAESANPHDDSKYWNNGVNKYACENTSDKVFLLSEEEVTNSSYGFEMYTSDKARVMITSDYSRATGAQMNDNGIGWWWLRSPSYEGSQIARGNIGDGQVQRISVYTPREGVVPALIIKL